jgi:hypothetical protein
MGRKGHILKWVLVVVALVVSATAKNLLAEERNFSEYEVKAGFVYNFVKFVDWPEKSSPPGRSTMTLCVIGKDPFGSAVEEIRGKTVRGRRLEVRHIYSLRDLRECQALFIASSERERLPRIVESAKEANVLTIADSAGFGQQGVIINLLVEDKKVKFEINVEKARQARLVVSSKLLKLAQTLYDE